MSRQVISRKRRIEMFLREYYLGNSIWRTVVRLIGGPAIIAYGIHLYQASHRSAVAYGGFCFLYGIYFTLKPILLVALRPASYKDIDFNVILNANEIHWTESNGEFKILFSSFKRILRRPTYYLLQTSVNSSIYLLTEQLSVEEQTTLNTHLAN